MATKKAKVKAINTIEQEIQKAVKGYLDDSYLVDDIASDVINSNTMYSIIKAQVKAALIAARS